MNPTAIVNALNRPGIRWLAAVGASVAETYVRGQPTVVQPLPGDVFLHRHVDGKIILPDILSRMTPAQQDEIARDINCFSYMPQPGDTVLDIGAGYGEETLTFSRLVGAFGHVISVEAHPVTFRRLLLTCEYNKLNNVTAIQVAVADGESTVVIDDGTAESGGYMAATLGGTGRIEVPATTIDTIIETHGCRQVDLLKMNIEGAEQLAVRGMTQSLTKIRNVAISCHDFILQAGRPDCESDWFSTYGTVTTFLREAGFTLADQRVTDPRPWVRYYVYGSRAS